MTGSLDGLFPSGTQYTGVIPRLCGMRIVLNIGFNGSYNISIACDVHCTLAKETNKDLGGTDSQCQLL